MNKIKKITSLLAVCALLLCSCNNTNQEKIVVNKGVTLSEVYSTADEALTVEYDNLTMPESICLSETDKLYTFDMIPMYSTSEGEMKELFTDFLKAATGEDIDIDALDYKINTGPTGTSIKADYGDYSYSFSDSSGFFVNHRYTDDILVANGKIISYDTINENTDYSQLNGLDGFPVSEAIEIAQPYADKLKSFTGAQDVDLYSVSIHNIDGKYVYRVTYTKTVEDISISESGEIARLDGFIFPTFFQVLIDENKTPFEIGNYYSRHIDFSSMKEIDDGNYISLKTACQKLSDFLAKYKPYRISNIDITYYLATRYTADETDDTNTITNLTYRPCYELTLALNKGEMCANYAPRISAYIDMVTGEIFISDSYARSWFHIQLEG